MNKTAIIAGGLVLILIIVAVVFIWTEEPVVTPEPSQDSADVQIDTEESVEEESAESEVAETVERPTREVIGKSAGGRDIVAYSYGNGSRELLLISGIHGGYAWNTALLGQELNDFLASSASSLNDVRVTIIPVLNPDGLHMVTGSSERFARADVNSSQEVQTTGRFNANRVDLNRNFDCEWQASGVWRNTPVSGGTAPFSEPESAALRDYIAKHRPDAVIAYFSAAGGVYASNCRNGVLPATRSLLSTYGVASGYQQHNEYDYYAITGDMVNWLAKEGIPAISVVLTDHTNTELPRNRAGLEAVIKSLQN